MNAQEQKKPKNGIVVGKTMAKCTCNRQERKKQ